MKYQRNRHGTRLSKDGYVLCSKCKEEVSEISRDTDPHHALCRKHGTWGSNTTGSKEAITA